jgi:hypothetical protein
MSDDPISEWANRLTPEGAPGQTEAMARAQMGDVNYERYRDHAHGVWETDLAYRWHEANRHKAKVEMRRALVLATLVGLALAVGWSMWAWVVVR